MQQGVQSDATCNIQNVASVCTQPKNSGVIDQYFLAKYIDTEIN